MDLFELKYTEEINDLHLQIQSILDYYLIHHRKTNMTELFDLIQNNTEIIEYGSDSDEENIDNE
tara:strand:- start:212 stop:403 length:192 start_codon:yes stop_codon:yes gene_type:complete